MANGWCEKRKAKARNRQAGSDNSNYKGGRSTRCGYNIIRCRDGKWRYEHVLFMEQHIGRELKKYGRNHKDNEVVHHIDGDKQNNVLSNLQLMTHGEHTELHNLERGLRYWGVNAGRVAS